MTGQICKSRNVIIENTENIKNRISDGLDNAKKDIKKSGNQAIKDLKETKKNMGKKLEKEKKKLKNMYLKQGWRHKRPDVTLLMELIFVVVLSVILYYAWPYLTGSVRPQFSKAQFDKAAKLPETAFNLEDIAKVNIEVKSLQDYANFFKSSPYSMKNSGVYDLMVNVAILPLIVFFIQFILPPFVIGYIIWFIIRFWRYVIAAAWGWFVAMYKYFTRLIQGKLGCKWYIRMVTGWGCNSPDFYYYFITWRRRYVDRPIYYEKLKYIQKYYWARKHYYIIPWEKYITIPYRRYKVKTQFAKKLYIDRSIEIFLKKLRDMYPQYYSMPRNEFYKWLLGNNRNLAAVYAKAIQAKSQIEGKPYRSITENGRQCVCPGTKTPLKTMKKVIKKQVKQGKHDVDILISTTNKIYDQLNNVKEVSQPDCKTIDKVIDKRKKIAGLILALIVGIILSLYVYSTAYGTPSWLKNIISPTYVNIVQGANLISMGKTYWSLPVIYLVSFSSVMLAVLYS